MNSPVLLVFLLVACCLLSEAAKLNPVERLSDILTRLTGDDELEANVNIALGHNWDKERSAVQEAANAFKKLHPKEPCHVDNVDSIAALHKLNRPVDELKALTNQRPKVIRLLDQIKENMEIECFFEAEEEWKKDAKRTSRFESQFPELIYLSDILRVSVRAPIIGPEVEDLFGVKLLSVDSNLETDDMEGEIIRKVLRNINEFKGNKESLDSIDRKKAKTVIKEYLVNPCKKLLVQPEARTFFYRIFGWAQLVTISGNSKLGKDRVPRPMPEFKSMFWAARWAFCNLLVQKSYHKEMSKRTANIESSLFSCFNADRS